MRQIMSQWHMTLLSPRCDTTHAYIGHASLLCLHASLLTCLHVTLLTTLCSIMLWDISHDSRCDCDTSNYVTQAHTDRTSHLCACYLSPLHMQTYHFKSCHVISHDHWQDSWCDSDTSDYLTQAQAHAANGVTALVIPLSFHHRELERRAQTVRLYTNVYTYRDLIHVCTCMYKCTTRVRATCARGKFLCVCVYIEMLDLCADVSIYIHTHTCVCVSLCVSHICADVCIYIHILILYMQMCVYICADVCIYIRTHMCVRVCLCVCHIHVQICVYIYN